MPTDPHLVTAPSHGLARASETIKTGITGAAGGDIRRTLGHADYDKYPLGTSALGFPTNIVATPGAGQVSLAFTEASGGDSVEVVVRVNATKVYVKQQTGASTPIVVTGLTAATEYVFYLRTIAADGSISPFAAGVTGTPT